MKNVALSSFLTMALLLGAASGLKGQNEERLGLPGDNLNLYGVMKLFQESPTLEEFERNLNDPDKMLNNLDLNGDYQVDYINVVDYVDGNVHNIVLRVSINRSDYQDVAVFTVQPGTNGSVYIQLIGDEALYGKNYIIEPYYDNGTPNPGYSGSNRVYYGQNVTIHRTTTVEVSAWPIVRFIFAPSYVVWHSPWYFGYYPRYWSPWRPYYWDYYVGYHNHWDDYYYGYYHRWNVYRYNRYNDFYYHSHRDHSDMIDHRIASDSYRDTYSRPDLRDKGSNRFHEMHPDNQGHNDNGNHYGQDKQPGQNNGNHNGNNNSQGQGRTSTTTRPDQQNTNQSARRQGGSYNQTTSRTSTEGQMFPNQGQRPSSQYGSQNNSGSRNNQQSGTRPQYSGSRTSTTTNSGNSQAQQTSNRGGGNTSYSRPADKSGDRPTTVPGSSRSSMGGGQNRSSSGQSAVHNQGGHKSQSPGSSSKPASTKSSGDKDSGGRRK
jgi:hypothetical protein